MGRIGIVAMLLGVLFAAYESNEWMKHAVIERSTPANRELPAVSCPEDELEEEGLSVAECEQMVSDVRSILVSAPSWFAGFTIVVSSIGTVLALGSVLAGAALLGGRSSAPTTAVAVVGALIVIDTAHFIAVLQAGPIIRAMYLNDTLLWFLLHLALVIGVAVGRRNAADSSRPALPESHIAAYGPFEIVGHWALAVCVLFLFVSSWWMLALPLPSNEMTFREFPFQLHKNIGITVAAFVVAMAAVRLLRRRASHTARSSQARKLAIAGHSLLYVLIAAVCVSGYLSSTYSGWGTTFWWAVELPYWGREDEALNQLYSDIHLWTCWALLGTVAVHIGAALYHAFRDDGIVQKIVRW